MLGHLCPRSTASACSGTGCLCLCLKHLCIYHFSIYPHVLGSELPKCKWPGCMIGVFLGRKATVFLLYCVNLLLPCMCPGKCASRQRLSGAPGSLEPSWLLLQSCVYSVCLCALQALKRKPDLFLCSNLDVKAVFQCGEYCGRMVHTGTCSPSLCRVQPAAPAAL